ncbi:hypothetical protein ACTMU2_19200 [Cupriavidus basilensis]
MARMLGAGGYPVEIALQAPPADKLPPVQQAVVRELVAAINGYAEAGTAATPQRAAQAKRCGFLDADAFTNDHVRYALKTTGAAMFCYVLYQQLNWPGIHTCFITCYLVSLGTMAESVEKLSLRLAGCMIGAVIGTAAIVYVVPSLSSIGGLMLLVFAGTWISAWVARGFAAHRVRGVPDRIRVLPVRGAGRGAGAADLTIARDRVIRRDAGQPRRLPGVRRGSGRSALRGASNPRLRRWPANGRCWSTRRSLRRGVSMSAAALRACTARSRRT